MKTSSHIALRGIRVTPRRRSKGVIGSRAAKRGFDLCMASIALVLLSPIFALVAIPLRCSDSGPIFFGHQRIGYNGKPFKCLKFRTMVVQSEALLRRHLAENPEARREWEETQKLRDDPRITSLGKILRRSSLDELPQLINIIKGEMSFVGPRPIVQSELKKYGAASADYLSVRPGLTGLWQISGRNDTSYEERVRLDREYVRKWSFIGDLRIILRTVPVVFCQKGSC